MKTVNFVSDGRQSGIQQIIYFSSPLIRKTVIPVSGVIIIAVTPGISTTGIITALAAGIIIFTTVVIFLITVVRNNFPVLNFITLP